MSIPSIKEQTKELILDSLKLNYNSVSCKDNIVAGNHYQSVLLGTTETRGFRTSRAEFLDQIQFEGSKVLDLGSNLGEISRAARARGAYLVDGFEYDPFFIEVASLVNAYNNTTRVSFYQRDITNPSIYTEHYNIVLAFSVFTFIRSVLDQIAAITDKLFILETHKLEDNLETAYLNPVLRHFPYYKILGESDWSNRAGGGERRAVIAFAKDESALASLVLSSTKSETDPADSALDTQSTPQSEAQPQPIASMLYVNVGKTCLQERFFVRFNGDSTSEILSAIEAMELDLDALAESDDLKKSVYSGWAYWTLFLKGYLQYAHESHVHAGNIYYDYMMNYYAPRQHDPGLANVFADANTAAKRITQRFEDFDLFRNSAGEHEGVLDKLAPIKIFVGDVPEPHKLLVHVCQSDTPLVADAVDGWHRLFSAKLWNVEKLACQVIQKGPSVE
jgi:SAM-dependent methyltransferase